MRSKPWIETPEGNVQAMREMREADEHYRRDDMANRLDKLRLERAQRFVDSITVPRTQCPGLNATHENTGMLACTECRPITPVLSPEAQALMTHGPDGPDETLVEVLTTACTRYCDWYEHGNAGQAGMIAYDLVSSIRQALLVLDAMVPALSPEAQALIAAVDAYEKSPCIYQKVKLLGAARAWRAVQPPTDGAPTP